MKERQNIIGHIGKQDRKSVKLVGIFWLLIFPIRLAGSQMKKWRENMTKTSVKNVSFPNAEPNSMRRKETESISTLGGVSNYS